MTLNESHVDSIFIHGSDWAAVTMQRCVEISIQQQKDNMTRQPENDQPPEKTYVPTLHFRSKTIKNHHDRISHTPIHRAVEGFSIVGVVFVETMLTKMPTVEKT